MATTNDVLRALDLFPPKERAEIRALALEALRKKELCDDEIASFITQFVLAGGRAFAKKQSDARTDPPRRVLVGARVKREFGEKCKQAAEARGVSLYAWVCEALERALEAQWMD